MTVLELGKKLREMYETPGANKTTMIHLFGIIYSDEITNAKITAAEIIHAADMQPSYATEVYKGIRLGEYVELKSFYKNKF